MDQDFFASMAEQFAGVPMDELISGPLMASCSAELKTALASAQFIRFAGFDLDAGAGPQVRFEWQRAGAAEPEILSVPLPGATSDEVADVLATQQVPADE